MPSPCCIEVCGAVYGREKVSFHRFPSIQTTRDALRRELWITAAGVHGKAADNLFICGQHFETGKPAAANDMNSPNWIPTLKLGLPDTISLDNSSCEIGNAEENVAVPFDASFASSTHQIDFLDDPNDILTESLCEEVLFSSSIIETECIAPILKESDFKENEKVSRPVNAAEFEFSDIGRDNSSADIWQEVPSSVPSSVHDASDLEMHVPDLVSNLHDRTDDNQQGNAEYLEDFGIHEEPVEHQEFSDMSELAKYYEKLLEKKDQEIASFKSIIEGQRRVLKSVKFDLKSFETNDLKVKHLTGLPSYNTLCIIYNFVRKGILTYSNVLSKEQTFVMVLMYLRLGLSFTTLGYLFHVCTTTITKYFYSCLYSLYMQLKGLVKWPSRELLKSNTPAKFQKLFDAPITVILDCFEVFTEKPGVKDAIVKMYSSYKHHYTVKEMIGITPFGSISFISKPYTGRSSDKYITENSGFTDNLIKDDIVLADRGFTTRKAIEDKGAKLRVPDSASKKMQLSSSAVERTRALASVRNEVERVIGGLRQKNEVLNKRLPITALNHEHNGENILNMMVTVSCALYNLCPSIIL